jgi:hypothetical protein
MKGMQFLTPVAGMDAKEARAYLKEHKEGTYTLIDVRQPSEHEKCRSVLHDIAEEEKGHLATLGALVEARS